MHLIHETVHQSLSVSFDDSICSPILGNIFVNIFCRDLNRFPVAQTVQICKFEILDKGSILGCVLF